MDTVNHGIRSDTSTADSRSITSKTVISSLVNISHPGIADIPNKNVEHNVDNNSE